MVSDFFLIFNSRGAARLTKNQPNLDFNEVSVAMKVRLPDSIFKKPTLRAEIMISEGELPAIDISPEVVNNIQDSIQQAAGVKVQLEFVKNEA